MRRTVRPFHPPATRESFKDLLIFEERLKQNAQRLQKQRRKYQGFLLSLTLVIFYLAYLVFLSPSIYSLVHYSNITCLLISIVTFVLFFATGMYSEKIAYAYKFVPQANRALRPFNVYLNTKHTSKFTRFILNNPFFRSNSSTTTPSSPSLSRTTSERRPSSSSPPSIPTISRQTSTSSISSFRSHNALHSSSSNSSSSSPHSSRSSSPIPLDAGPVTRSISPSPERSTTTSSIGGGGGVPIVPIPPASNPRGELIFSSRVHPGFREGYERYRGEWERRRKESSSGGSGGKKEGSWWSRIGGRIWSRGGEGKREKGEMGENDRRGGGETEKGINQSEGMVRAQDESERGRSLRTFNREEESMLSTISTPSNESPNSSRPTTPNILSPSTTTNPLSHDPTIRNNDKVKVDTAVVLESEDGNNEDDSLRPRTTSTPPPRDQQSSSTSSSTTTTSHSSK